MLFPYYVCNLMYKDKIPSLAFTIAINLLPIWGVWQWNWSPFTVFYLYWIETLIIAVFNALKILFSRGDDPMIPSLSLAKKAITYLSIRTLIFFFYLIFLVPILGFALSGKAGEQAVKDILFFLNTTFNFALLGFVLNQAIQFLLNFVLNEEYKKSRASDYAPIFDNRQIIIHLAVIITAFIIVYLKGGFSDTETEIPLNQSTAYLYSITAFCIVKIMIDIVKIKRPTQTS